MLICPLFAQEIQLKDTYCISNSNIKISDIDKTSDDDKTLLSLPKSSSNYQVPSIKIINLLQSHGYEVLSNGNGIVKFQMYCNFDLEILYDKFLKALKSVYPDVIVNSLKIEPKNQLPSNIENFSLQNISVSKSTLKREKGMILAKFDTPNGRSKSIYFKFNLVANLEVFLASSHIRHGTVLQRNAYTKELVSLKQVPQNPLLNVPVDSLIAKFNIKKGTILSKRAFKQKKLLKRGDWAKAILKDGALSLEFDVKILNGGNLGESIRVLSRDGKTFTGIIKDKKTIYIK